ncbi:MAG: discoidin domain-containing protein [Opitutales bacterium]|nr:discoidin domain-containing protein [Opitutales bacterium]
MLPLRTLLVFCLITLSGASALATPSNLALQRPVVASSQNNSNTPGWAAVDGNFTTDSRRWISSGGASHWLEVDLEYESVLSGFRFWTGGGGSYGSPLTAFALQQWNGQAWQVIHSEVDHVNAGVVDISFTPTLASKRVRMVFTGFSAAAQNQVRMFELEILGEPNGLRSVDRSPAPGSSTADVGVPVHVDFNAAINIADASGIRVTRLSDGVEIPAGTVSAAGARLQLSPALAYGQTYSVSVPAGALTLDGDPGIVNGDIFWSFTVLPAEPAIASHSDTLGVADPFTVTFDREVELLDASLVRVFNVETGDEVPLSAVDVAGAVLSLTHAGLLPDERHVIEVGAGAVRAVASQALNLRSARAAYSGEFIILPTATFATGLDGFRTGFSEGFIGNVARRWGRNSGIAADEPTLHSGPGEDFTWLGTNRASPSGGTYANDFGATPALPLEEGEQYTLTFQYALNNTDLRVDLRPIPVRDQAGPVGTIFPHNHGFHSTGNFTITAESTGPQHFVFYGPFNGNSYPWIRIDNVSVVKTVPPAIHWDTPEADVTILEKTPLQIRGDAFGISAPLNWVRVYLDDRLLGQFNQSRFDLTLTDYDPGHHTLRIVARDTRGIESTLERPITVLFADGTLSPFVQYSFRDGMEGVTANTTIQNGYLNFPSNDGVVWASTPRLFLRAGESYVVQFNAHRANASNHTLFLSLEDAPGYPADPVVLADFNVNQLAWVTYQTTIHVEANGAYFITLFNDGQQNANRVWIDNIRIVGDFNSAPSVAFTSPPNGTTTLAGAPIRLSATAADTDGHVERVEFWNGPLPIATLTSPPYEWLWESAPVGNLTVTALAFDNDGGVSDPATVSINSLENRVSISTNLGSAAGDEIFRAAVYQPDGTLVLGGNVDPHAFGGITPQVLSSAPPDATGVVVRMSGDGRTVLSVSVVGDHVAGLSVDATGNIHVAAGGTGILKLNPTADTLIWHHPAATFGISGKQAHRIDTGDDGTTAALFANGAYGSQTLGGGEIVIIAPDGTPHPASMPASGGTYTTDIAIDTARERVWITGWKNFTTFEGSFNFPVDVPIFAARSYAAGDFGTRLIRGYDWESNDDNGRWLNRLENNMADTRAQRVVIAPNGDIYIALEYDGGNTPIRRSPYDLAVTVPIVGGDQYHNNAFTTTAPKVAIIRLEPEDGAFISGQYLVPRLSSGGDNTIRITGGGLAVDAVGRVHIVGGVAAGAPHTFNPLPGLYTGGGIHWVMSPDLASRELVTRWATSGSLAAVAIAPNGRVALAGHISAEGPAENPTDRLYRRRAFHPERLGTSDALLVVGDFSHYYSFQPGNHPRLFFGAEDIPELRHRATQAPFDEMVATLVASLDHNGDYLPFDPNHSYSRSMRAKINAFLYVLTGDEAHALAAREDVQWVIDGNHYAWADPALMGLRSYWMATHVALAYDWCAMSPHWDDAFLFTVSTALLDIAKVIVNNGGTEQNSNTSSNWQGARGSAGGLALLATDSRFDPALLDAAYSRARNYINASVGTHPQTRGWAAEAVGYTAYPYGLFVGPFAQAMARLDGRDLAAETALSEAYLALISARTSGVNVYDYGGIKPDWANDNMHIRGEGVYGQAFHFIDPTLLPAARWVYDRLQGPLAPDRARWDDTRGGTIWSFLHYPADVPPQSPLEFYGWQSAKIDQHGIGISTFRNAYSDEHDILAQFKARLFAVGGHDGPDGLGFRVIGNNTAWVVGGGRNDPAKTINQSTLYKVEPGAQLPGSTNLNTGTLVGTPLVKTDGGGHIIASMEINNMGVINHKRWFAVDFDEAATGAQAVLLVADTSNDGTHWQLPTSPFNTVSTSGNTFTITAPDGATLHGTVLHPAGATLAHGTRPRGDGFAPQFGGSLADIDPVLNPDVAENKFITAQGSGGQFLVAMTIQPAGQSHPTPARTGGTVADATVEIGARTYTFTTDDILYDGLPYTHPPAQIVFDAGDGIVLSGSTHQSVPYGGSPTAPEVEPPAGSIFLGWDRAFDAVTRDMLVSAVYVPLEAVPSAPSFLRGSASTGGNVHLLWNDNSFGETGFTVQESVAGGSWNTVATVPENTTHTTLAGRPASTQLAYRVRAEGTGGPSPWSNTFDILTPPTNLPPEFLSTPPTVAQEGATFQYAILAEDPDEDSLVLSLVSGPSWLNLFDGGGGLGILMGVPVAGPPAQVVIAASDGINPPVEQSFTLEINPAPGITLIWPGETPVYLQPGHGLHAAVSVNPMAAGLSWNVIQGPSGTWIGSPHAEATDIYFDRAGTYTVRVTATAPEGATSQMDFQVLVDREPVREPVDVLEYDKSAGYVTTDRNFRDTAPLEEFGRRFHPFSTRDGGGVWQSPLNPAESAALHGGRFFGGWVAQRTDSSNTLNMPNPRGIDASGRLSLLFNSAYPATMHAVFFWLREDFKNADPSDSVILGPNSEFEIAFDHFNEVGQMRWLAMADGDFFVSQSTIANTSVGRRLTGIEIAAEMWAPFYPEAPRALAFDRDTPFDVPTSALGELEGVGFIVDALSPPERRFQLRVARFALTGEISEPFHAAPFITIGDPAPAIPGQTANLGATATFMPTTLTSDVLWTASGPASVTFGDATAAATTATAPVPGLYTLRLTATDDLTTTFRQVEWIVEPSEGSATLSILQPGAGAVFNLGDSVELAGSALDGEGADVSAQATWTSSIDGLLGSGSPLTVSTLSVGTHTLTFAYEYAPGLSVSDSVGITIEPPPPPPVYSVAFIADAGGSITGTLAQSIEAGGSTSPVTAVPDSGQLFTEWTWSGGSSTDNPLVLLDINANLTVTARFEPEPPPPAGTLTHHPGVSVYDASDFRTLTSAQLNENVGVNAAAFFMQTFLMPEDATVAAVNLVMNNVNDGKSYEIRLHQFGAAPGNSLSDADVAATTLVSSGPQTVPDGTKAETNPGGGGLPSTLTWMLPSPIALEAGTVYAISIWQAESDPSSLVWRYARNGAVYSGGTAYGNQGTGGNWSTSTILSGTNNDFSLGLVYQVGPGNTPPDVAILSPADHATFTEGEPIDFLGSANDAEDGDIAHLGQWTSSLDGVLGTGAGLTLTTLTVGTHEITFAATDSGELQESASITLTVEPAPPPPPAERSYLLTFGNTVYSTDGTRHWQSFRLQQTPGTASPKQEHHNVLLADTNGLEDGGIRVTLTADVTANMGLQTGSQVVAGDFAANPFDWFTPSEAAQRETASFDQPGAGWTYAFDGFNPTDEVTFQLVIRRTGVDRFIRLTFDPGGPAEVVLLDQTDSGVTQYVTHTVSGSDAYNFRITSQSAPGFWVALVNAMAVHVVTAPTAASPYETWANAAGLIGTEADPLADPDADGIPNLLEFALEGHPLQPGTAQLPVMSEVLYDGLPHLRLEVSRNPDATGLDYIVEVSSDLVNWSALEDMDIITLEDTAGSLVVEDAHPMSPGSPRFIRLRLEMNPGQ